MNTSSLPIALVTGATSGFGAVTAQHLSRAGFRVFGTGRQPPSPSPSVEMLSLDVDLDHSVECCVNEVLRRADHIDVLVNNAGRAMVGACEETRADEARALFETNLFGVMRVVNAVLPTMRRRGTGAIVNVGSLSGFVGVPFHGVYAASKHALAGYTEALRYELEPFGIRVALVEPAAHRTGIGMSSPASPLEHYDRGRERVAAIIRDQIEQGDDPEFVARAIVAAATGSATAFRHRVGNKAKFAAFARRWLPTGSFERTIRREFRIGDAG